MSIFDQEPSDAYTICYEICRPRPLSPLNVTIAQREYRGVWTHWFGGKTIACTRLPECPACNENCKCTWAGHIIGRRHEDDKYVLVVFTKPSLQRMNEGRQEGTGYLGLRVRFTRLGRKQTGPVSVYTAGHDRSIEEHAMSVTEKICLRLYADNANKREVKLDE